jgi:hypothetical protein
MSTTRPVVSVIGSDPPPALLRLLAAMRRWCLPVAAGQEHGRRPVAVVCVSSATAAPTGLPTAVWVTSTEELARLRPDAAARVLLLADPDLADPTDCRLVGVPPEPEGEVRPYLPPWVRARIRQARGLPDRAVVEQTGTGWRWSGRAAPLPRDAVESALAVAAAAVVGEPGPLRDALGYGTPTVTSPATARTAGAPTHAVVLETDAGERLAAARRLAADGVAAARLSLAAREHHVRRHDIRHAAAATMTRLLAAPNTPQCAWAWSQAVLAELGTPRGARINRRLADAVWPLLDLRRPA